MSILIKNAQIVSMVDSQAVLQGDIFIKGSVIERIGEDLREEADEIIDATGMAAMPGLINCHSHAAMALFRGYSDDLRLMDWLREKIWPAEEKLTPKDVYWGSLLAIAEMIRSGTTTFADMYITMDQVAKAVDEAGIRASLSRGLTYSSNQGAANIDEAESFIEKYNNSSNGRITCMFGPHAPYTCPPAYLMDVIERAAKHQAPIHIHLAETSEEIYIMNERYGKSPTEYLFDLGLFKQHVILAHSVNLSREDVFLLQGIKGGIAHNPISNMKLGCGVAPILLMRELGISVGMGTDGAGSATTLDMFEEMKAAAWMHKNQTQNPTAINAKEILQMATCEGAKVLGLADQVGSLAEGKKADVILIDIEQPHFYPKTDNLMAKLAYAASGFDVQTSIINGKVVMKDREILSFDVKEVLRESQKIVQRII
jgi:5-methylthioadenosine/S-adenosylhomocysteine deaminase